MTAKSNQKAVAPEQRHDDWFYDELMTAQPEATQAFFRERLAARQRAPKPKNKPPRASNAAAPPYSKA